MLFLFFCFQPSLRYCCGTGENKLETKKAQEDSQAIATFRGGANPRGAEERDVGSTGECSGLTLFPSSLFPETFVDILRGKKPSHPFFTLQSPLPGVYVLFQIPQKDLSASCTPECMAWSIL